MSINVQVIDTGMAYDLTNFPKQAKKAVRYAGRKAGREGVNDLKDVSPKLTGDYAGGWSLREKTAVGGSFEAVIHNRTHWGLIHLLEDGHWLFYMGRRTGKRTRAIVHFAPTVQKAGDNFVEYCDQYLDSLD